MIEDRSAAIYESVKDIPPQHFELLADLVEIFSSNDIVDLKKQFDLIVGHLGDLMSERNGAGVIPGRLRGDHRKDDRPRRVGFNSQLS